MFELFGVTFRDVLDIPSLKIPGNSITTLVGPSGSGKTTVLKLLNKMLSPTQGTITFGGEDLMQADPILHRRRVTLLSQTPAMFGGSVKDNLTAGLRFQKRDVPDDAYLSAMLEKVKLNKPLDSGVQTLSGGEKQRLALGRVLLLDSEVYLLDEPSSALDEVTAEAVIEMIAGYAQSENKTLVMVTHSSAIARRFSDSIIGVNGGKCDWRPV